MSLQVIGSGFGRTGTMTLKQVLESLGFGPCHHMIEIIEDPQKLAPWKKLASGETVDWEVAFAEYRSQVDWPGAFVWQQTIEAFPQARVIHTERPEDDWWNSFDGTVGKFFRVYRELQMPPPMMALFEVMHDWLIEGVFSDFSDRDCALAAYRENNQRVRDTVPAERLMVFDVTEGWEPLCRFLEVPVPDAPFPHTHSRKEFWEHFGGEPE